MTPEAPVIVGADLDGQTVAAVLRHAVPGLSWTGVKRLIGARRVMVNGAPCLNDARRVRAGERVEVLGQPSPPVPREQDVRILRLDPDIIVLDKPPGVITLRRDEERGFSDERKDRQPSLDELVRGLLPGGPRRAGGRKPRAADRQAQAPLYAVHRLDRDTSGLMLFALSARARDVLIGMFSRHEVRRSYIAVVQGHLPEARTIDTWLVRDRGDGLRGSSARAADDPDAQRAVTHVRPVEHIGRNYTVVECRLETGRTHQIRIHLSEVGHMLCGEKVYVSPRAGDTAWPDLSGAPRQALHSAELSLTHPITGQPLEFTAPLPPDLARWLAALRR